MLANNELYVFSEEGLQPCEESELERAQFPLLVVGIEHCREIVKQYPVTDKEDLSQIIRTEYQGTDFVEQPVIGEQNSSVTVWRLDEKANSIADSKWLYWIPESWLIGDVLDASLYKVSRAKQNIWLCRHNDNTFSSVAMGLFANRNYFLMASGVESNIPNEELSEQAYGRKILSAIANIDPMRLFQPFKAQNYVDKLNRQFSFVSLCIGVFVGFVLFSALHLGYLEWRISSLEEGIKGQKVAQAISVQKNYETTLEAMQKLNKSLGGQGSQQPSWGLLASLMEKGVTILRVKHLDNKLEVRAEAKKATDALQVISGLPEVAHATFITPVRESLGNERFTVSIELKSGGSING